MNLYTIREAFLATVEAIRRKNAGYNASVSTRQVMRANMRRQYYHLVEADTRQERRQLSRAYAAKEFKEAKAA